MPDWINNVCPHCFKSGYDGIRCNYCGYDQMSGKNEANSLPPFTVIDGKYMLGHCIGAGGFGITYVALDLKTQKRCAIKEYFPSNLAYRDRNTNEVSCSSKDIREYSHGLKRFYEEARTLATLKGEKNIVEIRAYLKANNTAYIVMEYVDGINLKKNMVQKGGTYSYDEAKRIFTEIAIALDKVHVKKLLHRDLTPENVLIKKDGSIKVIDFGSARDYIKNATGMSVMVKSGYAPVEQYSSEKKQGPYTDIYSLCCTIYFMLSGQYVPDAFDRVNGKNVPRLDFVVAGVPEKFASIIEKGMAVLPAERYQSIGEMLVNLQQDEPVVVPPKLYVVPPDNKQEETGFWHKIKAFLGFVEESESKSQPGTFNPPELPPDSGFKPVWLKIEQGPAAGFSYKITRDGSYTVGRSCTQCNVLLDGNYPEISRLHCIITSQNHGEKLFVEDRSANGTYSTKYGKLEPNKMYDVLPGEVIYLATKQYGMRIVK